MAKEKIPVYDICSLPGSPHPENDFLAERFESYLLHHSPSLHLPHRHNFYHLVLFTRGSGTHTIDFSRFKVKPFDIYFMVPGQVHSWQFEGETDGYIINFSESVFRSFLLNPNWIERFSFFDGSSDNSVCKLPVEIRTRIVQLFEDILEQKKKQDGLDMIRVLLLQLFFLVEQSVKTKIRNAIPQSKLVLLRSFRRLIDQHYMNIKLPKEYAEMLYVTPNHLNALCQDLLGKTAGELIRDRILLEAKRLLTNADMNVTEIAFALNFKDNSYFNRFFKKSAGFTPDEFRKHFIIPKTMEDAHVAKSER